MSNIDPELIVRINELAKKKKDGTISEAELEEQKELRQKYLKAFRSGFKQQLMVFMCKKRELEINGNIKLINRNNSCVRY